MLLIRGHSAQGGVHRRESSASRATSGMRMDLPVSTAVTVNPKIQRKIIYFCPSFGLRQPASEYVLEM